jgi:sporulation related protein
MISKNMKSSGIPGYRIRIYSESGLGAKEEQQRVRASFLSLYPGLDAYNRYDEPFFKIYVGDCRTRSEALKLQDIINKDFPNSIIREDYINIKSTD